MWALSHPESFLVSDQLKEDHQAPSPSTGSAMQNPSPAEAPSLPQNPRTSTTYTTGTVTAHQMFVRGLFLHRGLVRCTWVIEMKTGENGNIRFLASLRPCLMPQKPS